VIPPARSSQCFFFSDGSIRSPLKPYLFPPEALSELRSAPPLSPPCQSLLPSQFPYACLPATDWAPLPRSSYPILGSPPKQIGRTFSSSLYNLAARRFTRSSGSFSSWIRLEYRVHFVVNFFGRSFFSNQGSPAFSSSLVEDSNAPPSLQLSILFSESGRFLFRPPLIRTFPAFFPRFERLLFLSFLYGMYQLYRNFPLPVFFLVRLFFPFGGQVFFFVRFFFFFYFLALIEAVAWFCDRWARLLFACVFSFGIIPGQITMPTHHRATLFFHPTLRQDHRLVYTSFRR